MKSKVIVILVIMLIVMLPVSVFSYSGIDTNISIGGDTDGDGDIKDEAIYSSVGVTNKIVGVLQAIGTIVSVIALIIIGMRYMFSSVEEKAQMKGVIGYYITGCVLVFATSNVLGFAYTVIEDVDHNYGDITVETVATCTTAGTGTRSCTDVGCTKTITVTIPPLGHQRGTDWKTITEPTCVANGIKVIKCTRCSYEYDRKTISDPDAHLMNYEDDDDTTNYRIITQWDCKHDGEIEYYCVREGCSYVERDSVSKTNDRHNIYASNTTMVRSTEKGDYQEPTCVPGWQVWMCSVKGCTVGFLEELQVVDPNAHSMVRENKEDGSSREEPTCTENGYQVWICENKTYYDEECKYWEEEVLQKLGHDYAELTGRTPPTCTMNALYKAIGCTRCGMKNESSDYFEKIYAGSDNDPREVVPQEDLALGHNKYWAFYHDNYDCTDENGMRWRKCTRCTYQKYEVYGSKATEHNFINNWVFKENGKCEQIRYCQNEGCSVYETQTVHVWENFGLLTKKCTRCNEKKYGF